MTHKDLMPIQCDDQVYFEAEIRKGEKFTVFEAMRVVDNLRNIMATKTARCLPDFDQRPIFFDPPTSMKLPNNAIIIATSYPFGGHRCLRAMWLEKTTTGARCVIITSAFGGTWNKPKRGTALDGFATFMVDADNHWTWACFNVPHKCYVYENGTYSYKVQPFDDFLAVHDSELTGDERIRAGFQRAAILKRQNA